jgi:GT2 family glycosyltransferase
LSQRGPSGRKERVVPLISVIIPTNRSAEVVRPCLDALARQRFELREVEVIVVHNGGTGTPPASTGTWPFELIVEQIPQANVCAAKNVGLDRARGEWVIFLNDDVRPTPDLIAAHLAAHRRAGRSAIVSGKTEWRRWDDETVFDRLVQTTSMIFFYDQMAPHAGHSYRHAWTLNLSLARRYVEELRFDEQLGATFFYEDIELAFRLERAYGLRVWYCPDALAAHDHRHTLTDYLRREFNMGRAAPQLWRCDRDCFRATYGTDLDGAYVEYCRRFVSTEGRREDEMRQRLAALVGRKVEELGMGTDVESEIVQALYYAHLPLKRLAFRRGLLSAIEHNRGANPGTDTVDSAALVHFGA